MSIKYPLTDIFDLNKYFLTKKYPLAVTQKKVNCNIIVNRAFCFKLKLNMQNTTETVVNATHEAPGTCTEIRTVVFTPVSN